MKAEPHEQRERRRKREERRLVKVLAILKRPGAARLLENVAAWKTAIEQQLAAVRDPEVYRTWPISRLVPGTGTRRRCR